MSINQISRHRFRRADLGRMPPRFVSQSGSVATAVHTVLLRASMECGSNAAAFTPGGAGVPGDDQKHKFVLNRTANLLQKGKYHLIAIIVPRCADFFLELLQEIQQVGEKQDYQIIYSSTFDSTEREKTYLTSMIARWVDGVILLPVDAHAPPLSSIGFLKEELGRTMVEALLRMAESKTQEIDEILLRPNLVVRESSGETTPATGTPGKRSATKRRKAVTGRSS